MSIRIALEGGEPHDVAVVRAGARATVWIDSIPLRASITGAASIEVEGRRETVYTVIERDTVYLHAFGRNWTVELSDPVESSQRALQVADAATAPMPGMLVSVAVRPGDQVGKGQLLAVIESMKMQTEIAAPRDGVVDRVLAGAGDSVEGGAPLVTLVEPDRGAVADAAESPGSAGSKEG